MFGCGENMTLYTCTGSPAFGLVKVCGSICIEWADHVSHRCVPMRLLGL